LGHAPHRADRPVERGSPTTIADCRAAGSRSVGEKDTAAGPRRPGGPPSLASSAARTSPLAPLPNRLIPVALLAALLVAACFTSGRAGDRHERGDRRPVKVMIISMFGPEGKVWLDHLGPWRNITVPGLSPDYPAVHCNRSGVCVVTIGMG